MQPSGRKHDGLFSKDAFTYDERRNVYVCPAGQTLGPNRQHPHRQITDYVAPEKTCAACPLREQCTRGKLGRSIARHSREAAITSNARGGGGFGDSKSRTG